MGFAAALETARPKPATHIDIILDTVPKKDAADIRAALTNPRVTSASIARALRTMPEVKALDLRIAESTVRRYRERM